MAVRIAGLTVAAEVASREGLAAPGAGDADGEARDGERVQALAEAARRMDVRTIRTILDVALVQRGIVATWEGLCRPALAVISPPGADTENSEIDVEHLLSC